MGELNNIGPFIRMASSSSVFRLQNSSSSDMMTLTNGGNMVVAGTGQFSSLVNNTIIYNSGGNASLKIQGNTKVRRLESRILGLFIY